MVTHSLHMEGSPFNDDVKKYIKDHHGVNQWGHVLKSRDVYYDVSNGLYVKNIRDVREFYDYASYEECGIQRGQYYCECHNEVFMNYCTICDMERDW